MNKYIKYQKPLLVTNLSDVDLTYYENRFNPRVRMYKRALMMILNSNNSYPIKTLFDDLKQKSIIDLKNQFTKRGNLREEYIQKVLSNMITIDA